MKVGVIGAGAWGTSLAHLLAGKAGEVRLWAFEPEVVREINERQTNSVYLSGVGLDSRIKASAELDRVVEGAEMVVMVTPSHHLRGLAGRLAPHLSRDALVVTATKGIEADSLLFMTGVLEEVLGLDPGRLAVLSGPSFAREVALRSPTAVTAASSSTETGRLVQRLFWTDWFRVYTTPDTTGVQLGGAIKNVMAIAAGICEGLGLGRNPLAALITRGLAEISRLGLALGADPLTFSGLAGVGDLVLTCTSSQSRNYTVGHQLGQGRRLADILGSMKTVAEGVKTSLSAHRLAEKQGIEMPICAQIQAVLYQDKDPRAALAELMARDPKLERWGLEQGSSGRNR